MTRWTVQCGYAAYYANTVVVETETLDAALDMAIQKANDDPCWEPLDECGPTFIDAVAEGDDADPWKGIESCLPVPTRFSERGEPPRVTLILSGGILQGVEVDGGRVQVERCEGGAERETTSDPALPIGGARVVFTDQNNVVPPQEAADHSRP